MNIQITNAKYLKDYLIEIFFSDGKINKINFEKFISNYHAYPKYRDIEKFKQFKIENGNIVWGKNWDIIFHIEDLYNNNINESQKKTEEIYQTINL